MSDDRITCLACAEPIDEGAPSYPDVSGALCEKCAPPYAMLLKGREADGFVDLHSGEPLTAAERSAIYFKHIAAGGIPDDSMAESD